MVKLLKTKLIKKLFTFLKFSLLILLPLTIVFYKFVNPIIKSTSPDFLRDLESTIPIKFTPKIHWLSTSGNKIINEKGETVILRGVNIASVNWGYDEWNPRAVNYAIKEWHAKVIRTRIYPEDLKKGEKEFFQKLEKEIVTQARKKGVYVILHSFMPGSTNDLPTQDVVDLWQAVARHYKNDPVILYDLIPEPHDTTKSQLRTAYMNLIPKVRQANPKSLIFVTGLGWGREINSYLKDPLPFENIVYRSNPYNQAAEFEGLFGKIALKYPVFLGEFGADDYPAMSQESVQALIDYADQLGLGWTAWIFHSVGCPCLLDDWKTFKPSSYGVIVYKALQKQPTLYPLYDEIEKEEEGRLTIYDDQFHHGFIEQGWDRKVDLQSSTKPFKGKFSLEVKYEKSFAGLGLHTYDLVSPRDFSYLQFYLHFNQNSPFDLKVKIDNAQEQMIGEVEVNKYLTQASGGWWQIVIPLIDFGIADELISGLSIQENSDSSHQPIYIDEIEFASAK